MSSCQSAYPHSHPEKYEYSAVQAHASAKVLFVCGRGAIASSSLRARRVASVGVSFRFSPSGRGSGFTFSTPSASNACAEHNPCCLLSLPARLLPEALTIHAMFSPLSLPASNHLDSFNCNAQIAGRLPCSHSNVYYCISACVLLRESVLLELLLLQSSNSNNRVRRIYDCCCSEAISSLNTRFERVLVAR